MAPIAMYFPPALQGVPTSRGLRGLVVPSARWALVHQRWQSRSPIEGSYRTRISQISFQRLFHRFVSEGFLTEYMQQWEPSEKRHWQNWPAWAVMALAINKLARERMRTILAVVGSLK
jgi:hypothetical protein